jgi:hypothetical protein
MHDGTLGQFSTVSVMTGDKIYHLGKFFFWYLGTVHHITTCRSTSCVGNISSSTSPLSTVTEQHQGKTNLTIL